MQGDSFGDPARRPVRARKIAACCERVRVEVTEVLFGEHASSFEHRNGSHGIATVLSCGRAVVEKPPQVGRPVRQTGLILHRVLHVRRKQSEDRPRGNLRSRSRRPLMVQHGDRGVSTVVPLVAMSE